METKRQLTCIVCPMGCPLEVSLSEDGKVLSVAGNTCKRGEAYAIAECTAPTRVLTSTVKVEGGELPVVSVKSAEPIPKGLLFQAVSILNGITVKAPVSIGDVVVSDILDTGVDIVVTKNVPGGSR